MSSNNLISLIVDYSAPQDFISELQKQTSDVLIWNGYESVFNRFEATLEKVTEYFDTIDHSIENLRVENSDECTLEICSGNFVCWSSHPLIFEYFKKTSQKKE